MVPAYTAAAFIKKFARLALTAPPPGQSVTCTADQAPYVLYILEDCIVHSQSPERTSVFGMHC